MKLGSVLEYQGSQTHGNGPGVSCFVEVGLKAILKDRRGGLPIEAHTLPLFRIHSFMARICYLEK